MSLEVILPFARILAWIITETPSNLVPFYEGELAMNTQAIIAALDQQIARLKEVRSLLGSAAKVNGMAAIKRGPGRPKKMASVEATGKRILSAEAREKIAAAQKVRWAKARKAAKKAAKAEATA
jgi:hypothetical protein